MITKELSVFTGKRYKLDESNVFIRSVMESVLRWVPCGNQSVEMPLHALASCFSPFSSFSIKSTFRSCFKLKFSKLVYVFYFLFCYLQVKDANEKFH